MDVGVDSNNLIFSLRLCAVAGHKIIITIIIITTITCVAQPQSRCRHRFFSSYFIILCGENTLFLCEVYIIQDQRSFRRHIRVQYLLFQLPVSFTETSNVACWGCACTGCANKKQSPRKKCCILAMIVRIWAKLSDFVFEYSHNIHCKF